MVPSYIISTALSIYFAEMVGEYLLRSVVVVVEGIKTCIPGNQRCQRINRLCLHSQFIPKNNQKSIKRSEL